MRSGTADRQKGHDRSPVKETPDTIPLPDLTLGMNFFLSKNTSRAGWQPPALWVSLKQICLLLITVEDRSQSDFLLPLGLNSLFSTLPSLVLE